MTIQLLSLILAAFSSLGLLVGAGIFISRGTTVKGIDIMDKVITAYGVAQKLEEQKQTALKEQLSSTELERDALKVQLVAAQTRVSSLEHATSIWVLERTGLIQDIAALKKIVKDQEERIALLEGPSTAR